MSIDIKSTKDYTPTGSIVGDHADPVDNITPMTYIEWMSRVSSVGTDNNDMMMFYNAYLKDWSSIKKKSEDTVNIIADQYRALIKDIALNYTTDEEKRFLSNINYNDIRHVESSLPFFAAKIKQITLYYSRERDLIKQQRLRQSSSGSIHGVTRAVKSQITKQIIAPDNHNLRYGTIDAQTHETFENDYNVRLVELYDTSQAYFNNDNIPIDINTFAGQSNIIARVLSQCAPVLKLSGGINMVLAGVDNLQVDDAKSMDSLEYSEFFNYIKSQQNLNDLKLPDYANMMLGSDVMQLSGGDVIKLSDATHPWRNIFNRYKPSINIVPEIKLKTIEEIGGYDLPHKTGILTYYSKQPKPVYSQSDSAELLPDVYRFGNSVFSGVTGLPVAHVEDITWIKADNSNGRLFGDLTNTKNYPKFDGYTSTGELTNRANAGLSRVTDDLDFFKGDQKTEWSQDDIFKVEGPNVFDLQTRIDSLLIDHKTLFRWRTDIFGNEYALYKQIQPPRAPLDRGPGSDEDDHEITIGCQVIDGGDTLAERPDLYDRTVEYDIYEGGRSPGYDSKFEQSISPRPFQDLRRQSGLDEFLQPVMEEHNSWYYGIDPDPERTNSIIDTNQVTFHGFKSPPQYDEQAYGGLFTDEACGVIDPNTFKCEIIDNYAYNNTDEASDNGFFVSNHGPLTAVQDTYEQYLNPGTSEDWESLGFTGQGLSGIIQGPTVDGSSFTDVFCENKGGDFIYNAEQVPYYNQSLTVAQTKYSPTPTSEIKTKPTLYQQKHQTPGRMYFRSYNSSKIETITKAMSSVFGSFDFFDSSDHDRVITDINENNIIDMDIIYDNIIISTPTHILIEKINFDPVSAKILSNNTTNVLLRTNNGNPLERSLGWFFNENTNHLITGFTSVSGSVVYPRIFTVDLETLQYKQSFPNKDYPESVNDFILTDELSGYVVESVDHPIINYNERTEMYNVSYSSLLSGETDNIYAVFTNNYKQQKLNMRLVDACVFHGESVDKYVFPGQEWEQPVTSRTIRLEGGTELIPTSANEIKTQSLSLSSMTGHVLSGYQLDLTIDTGYIPVSSSGFHLTKIIFDPGDESPLLENVRTIDDGLQVLNIDITKIPDQSDPGDPRIPGFNYMYIFDKPDEYTYTAKVSAVYSDFSMIVYDLDIETNPYTMNSGFSGLKLLESKIYTDVTGNSKQLLVMETQSPRYISNIVIDR